MASGGRRHPEISSGIVISTISRSRVADTPQGAEVSRRTTPPPGSRKHFLEFLGEGLLGELRPLLLVICIPPGLVRLVVWSLLDLSFASIEHEQLQPYTWDVRLGRPVEVLDFDKQLRGPSGLGVMQSCQKFELRRREMGRSRSSLHYSIILIDRIHDTGRVIGLMVNKISALRAEVQDLKVGAGPEVVVATEKQATDLQTKVEQLKVELK
ncbi:hypothetical protein GW17_00019593 [Ensete ventricosum]|nr:hypothetical protein GW17_00019593 [Ensete ventricosum]